MAQIIGLLGAALLLIAWVVQNYRTVKSKDLEAIDVKFVLLSLFGSVILAYHAFTINDLPFIILNVFIAAAILGELFILVWKSR